MGWIFVLTAAFFEMTGVAGLKMFSQKKNILNGLLFLGGFFMSFIFLYRSFNYLDVSVAYAVWVGLGTAGAVALNMIAFGESKNLRRVASLILIIAGVVGLKAVS